MADNFVDFSDVYKVLGKLGDDVEKVANGIMNDLAPDVAKEFEKKVPYWTGSKDNMVGKRGTYMQEHARDNVVYTKAKDGQVEIGFDDDVAWRIHFIEFGTIHQPPQHIIEKSLDALAEDVQARVERELIRRLGL
ncbi:hypothetical protein GH854_33165 [Bacillus thuringiensis]|nr:hypothetical protein [Bacillus thuringiensis]